MNSIDSFQFVELLETAWELTGILGKAREGIFDPEEGNTFVEMLRKVEIPRDVMVPQRLVAVTWYLMSFLDRQQERVETHSGNLPSYRRFIDEVRNTLTIVLGTP